MIFSCEKHVKEGLKAIDLPHVHTISEYDSDFVQQAKCDICGRRARYKLFNYLCHRKKKQAI
ncbi:hypothetical protein [Bacillus sp. REN3]|uniref:hypothetical protein n=1 Tax=Bacillus sp. REN3 TaxID=2802440 RepID=UPI001AED3B0B|nr:hypothetical protein [Bacillus sp. REN3]